MKVCEEMRCGEKGDKCEEGKDASKSVLLRVPLVERTYNSVRDEIERRERENARVVCPHLM